MSEAIFRDRTSAGEQLAAQLLAYRDENPIVFGIPKGGIIIGCPISKALNCRLEVCAVRKLPIPWDPEAGFGAVTADGSRVLNKRLVLLLDLSDADVAKIASEVKADVNRRSRQYIGNKPAVDIRDKTVIIVDDGIASGYTMLAAIESMKKIGGFRKLVVAAPVASAAALKLIRDKVDDVICLKESDERVFTVASSYLYFSELRDEDVVACLRFK
jgi:putative phosphoribosyl transferase